MADNRKLALSYLGVNQEDVLVYRQNGDEVIVIVDKGILGCPKYVIPISQLTAPKSAPLPVEEAEVVISIPEYDDMDYRQLQTLAKERGIAANQSKDDLISALEVDYAFDEEE